MLEDLKEIPIGLDINSVADVEEFTNMQYTLSRNFGMQPVFKEEKFYYFKGKMNFANVEWSEDSVFGVINNFIYKVSLMTSEDNKEKLEVSFQKIIQLINKKTNTLGEFSKKGNKVSWFYSDGNILLTKKEMLSFFIISLNFTSSIIKKSSSTEKSKVFLSFLKSKWIFNLLKRMEYKK